MSFIGTYASRRVYHRLTHLKPGRALSVVDGKRCMRCSPRLKTKAIVENVSLEKKEGGVGDRGRSEEEKKQTRCFISYN
jgi:hypothetical protein